MPEAATEVRRADELRWREFAIPGSTPPVRLAYLHVEPDKAFTALVQFPAGWSRPDTGWYDHIEEVLFLDGVLEMSGVAYAAGDYGWFPAGYVRAGSSSAGGALALAWFSGPNQWRTDPSPVGAAAEHGCVRHTWAELPALPSPLGRGQGRLLNRSSDRTCWVVDTVPDDRGVDAAAELFSLAERTWVRLEAGAVPPPLPAPAFVRSFRP